MELEGPIDHIVRPSQSKNLDTWTKHWNNNVHVIIIDQIEKVISHVISNNDMKIIVVCNMNKERNIGA